jgi:CubicO group peptidase (beta-lactamase class C family)
LVEEISGVNFNTHWRLDEVSQTIVQPYNYSKRQYKEIPHYTFTDYPNGGLRSTAPDLFKFLSAFTQGGKVNNYQLLNQQTINTMVTPKVTCGDTMAANRVLPQLWRSTRPQGLG